MFAFEAQPTVPKELETDRVITFGPFRLFARERCLLEGDRPVRLGSRALDILFALLAHPGEQLSKCDLMRIVWPDTVVVEANLSVQVAALRRALGDGDAGSRYIVNSPGRGYRFVAPVTLGEASQFPEPSRAACIRPHNLPAQLTRLVGRDEIVDALVQRLATRRLLTIVGPGGVGKTAVALAVAERLIGAYEDGVWFIELAPSVDPHLVPTALASALRLEIRSNEPLPALVSALRDKQMLLVLDNCEHVIDAAAALAADILKGSRAVQIVATSREPLRVEGERTHRLQGLESPPASDRLSAAETLRFSAARLFVERVTAAIEDYELSDADAPSVRDICRNLDGIPLALEFAAARVDAFGVQGVAARVGDLLRLLTNGCRSAPPRHKTITTVLDWSYQLLSSEEQTLLRRLAVFVGGFTLESAAAIAASADETITHVADRIASLVPKSLVASDEVAGGVRFRLLETTRVYALAKLEESGEADALARRHAVHYRDLLLAGRNPMAPEGFAAPHASELDNIRAALAWAFAPEGDKSIALALAEGSAPIWLEMALLSECHAWMGKALDILDLADRGSRRELVLQAAFGSALVFTGERPDDAYASWARTLRLARKLKDIEHQLIALLLLWAMQIRRPVFADADALASQLLITAEQTGAAGPVALAQWMLGVTRHHLGRHAEARQHLTRSIDGDDEAARQIQVKRFGYDRRVDALAVLGNLLWIQGQTDQAASSLARAVTEARGFAHALPLCVALAWKGFTLTFAGDDPGAAENCVGELVELAGRHNVESYHGLGLCLAGVLQARRGAAEPALTQLAAGLAMLARSRYEVFHPILMSEQLRILALAGRCKAEREAVLASTHMRLDAEHWCIPEMLRIRGEIALLPHGDGPAAAEDLFTRAVDQARRQRALSWEIRAATSLAQLWAGQGRGREAHTLLAAVYGRFTEGFETADLREASWVLAELDRTRVPSKDPGRVILLGGPPGLDRVTQG